MDAAEPMDVSGLPEDGGTLLDSVPEELVPLLVGSLGERELCSLACTCKRFRDLITHHLDSLWAALHRKRWSLPPRPPPDIGWRLEFVRRHLQDARVMPLLQRLLSAETRNAAWKELLRLGEEVYDCVLKVADLEPMDAVAAGLGSSQGTAVTGGVSSEAWKVLRAINQMTVRREWEELNAEVERHERGLQSNASMPLVEDGALLLVRFYVSGDGLRAPSQRARDVLGELAAMSARLAAKLEPGYSAVHAVRTLAHMLFEEMGFCGNQQNYYDYRNSLLDHVIASRTGIPISLSVMFAAICRRVGVHLDMIGLPGHFLLATRGDSPEAPRVFVDAFNGGAMLGLDQCEQIVRSYGIRWSEEMATSPVQVSEVWHRMVRNLINCHKQTGELEQAFMVQALLPRENGTHTAPQPPYPGDVPRQIDLQASPAVLMHMLQNVLQMQQQD